MFDWDLGRLNESEHAALAIALAKRGSQLGIRWGALADLPVHSERASGSRPLPPIGVLEVIDNVDHAVGRLDAVLQQWAKRPTAINSRVRAFAVVHSGLLDVAERRRLELFLSTWATSLSWTMWRVWDREDLHDQVSLALPLLRPYFEKLAPKEYLERVGTVFSREIAEVAQALAINCAAELTSKQWVRTGDAGYGDSSKLKLADIAIDLPCGIDGFRRPGVVSEALTRASGSTDRRRSTVGGEVVVGGPGQGKSTIAQLIAHAFRIALLSGLGEDVIGERAHDVRVALAARLARSGVQPPARRRWPVLIDLAQFGPKAGDVNSLLTYIASGVQLGGKPLDGGVLLNWIRYWPMALILDGLDEVPDRTVRSRVIELLASFIATCNAHGVDLHVIATTRPQGYQNEFEDLLMSTRVTLVDLTETEALAYSDELNALRNADDPELAVQVTERLVEAVHTRLTQRLMTTPLQVTIMTALAERAVDLPTTRYELFDDYYQTIYDRELAKGKVFAKLRTHRSHVDHLHERAGLELQKRSESGGSSNALLTRPEVFKILVKRLEGAGFEEGNAKSISDEVLQLSTDRLVMLVSPRVGRYGFEVRSLQEYMAARSLSEGEDDAVLRAIEVLLPSAHWRNTWLLLVGRVLSTRERLRPRVLAIVQSANARDESGLLLTGSLAALDLYLDQIAADFPVDRDALLAMALELFADYDDEVPRDLVSMVATGIGEGSRSSQIVLHELHRLSVRSNANLATLHLSNSRHGVNALAKQAVTTLAEGRKWERGARRDQRAQNFVLAERVREQAGARDDILELANVLSGELLGSSAGGMTVSAEMLAGIAPARANAALLRVAAALRISMPDVAQQAIRILRTGVESAPQAKNLERTLRSTKVD